MSQNRFPNLNHLLPPRGQPNPPPPPGQHMTTRRTTRQSEAQLSQPLPSSPERGTMARYPLQNNTFRPAPPSMRAPAIIPAEQPSEPYFDLDEFDQSILSLPDIYVPAVDDVVPRPPPAYNTKSYGPPPPPAAAPYRNTYASDLYISDFHRPGPIRQPVIPPRAAVGVADFVDPRLPPTQGSRAVPNSQAHRALQQGPISARPASSVVSYGPGSSSPVQNLAIRRRDNPSENAYTEDHYPLPEDCAGTPIVQGIPLVDIRQALPDKFRAIFPFELFNAVQSKCFRPVYGTNDNVVVSAPTGSGKTAILELAICKLALDRGQENFKIVYIAPTKALCSERARDWEKKFSHMGLKCLELTGDTSQFEVRRVGEASIIVTTPEKWDSITRKWHDHKRLVDYIGLFLIDEVHILKDIRGATLEAVVSRMKTIGGNVRFLALSATVPNSDDIARWLGRSPTNQHLPAHRETFGEEYRPVKLKKYVYGYECNGNDFIFDKFLDAKLPPLLSRHSQQKPILIFCFTRKSCESTASMLADYVSTRSMEGSLWPIPSKRIAVISRELHEIVKFGVAFHHAGLDAQDRIAVEQAFLKGQLSVICCTSTLAVGINLPCHTAVLKGTVAFSDDDLQEYSDLEVMQMLGRAGRPQFDNSATAIILTRVANKQRYERMVSGREVLESTLHLNLIEHLNSEIALEFITSTETAKQWLKGTFLSIRLGRNPGHYRLTGGTSNPTQIDDQLEEICDRNLLLLQESQVIIEDKGFKPTEYGRAMSKYMVQFATMKMILLIAKGAGLEAMITILSQAVEFREFRFKPAERALFREINKSPLILYPVKEPVNQTWHKVSLIIQSHVGSVQFPDSADAARLKRQIMAEKNIIIDRLLRLVRAVVDCKGADKDSVGMKNGLELIPNIGPAGMRKLTGKNIRTVLELADKDSLEIEQMMSRNPPFGKTIQDCLKSFPRLDIDLVSLGHKGKDKDSALVGVKATLRYLNSDGMPTWAGKNPALTFLVETPDGRLWHFWRGSIRRSKNNEPLVLTFSVRLTQFDERIICHLSCEEVVGTIVTKVLKHGLPESAFRFAATTSSSTSTALAARPVQQSRTPAPANEYLDDYGLDDADFLEAVEDVDVAPAQGAVAGNNAAVPSDEVEDFPSIDQLLARIDEEKDQVSTRVYDLGGREESPIVVTGPSPAQQATTTTTTTEPVRLANGRWKCNHPCSGGVKKSGEPCSHRCCREGVEGKRVMKRPANPDPAPANPPPPSKRRRQATVAATSDRVWEEMEVEHMHIECIDLSQVDDEVGAPADLAPAGGSPPSPGMGFVMGVPAPPPVPVAAPAAAEAVPPVEGGVDDFFSGFVNWG